jgi:hypothetical protein
MALSVEQYNAKEEKALQKMGVAQITAFGTKTFEDHNFQTRIDATNQISKYADFFVNADLERLDPGKFFRVTPVRSDYSKDEVKLLTQLSDGVQVFLKDTCGENIGLHFTHLACVGILRVVQTIVKHVEKNKLSIFEAGPGCGYTGTALGLVGHKYASYDVTQGYYLWQSHLYDHFFGNEFLEVLNNEDCDFGKLPRISHLPWWVFAQQYKDVKMTSDIVLSNANLSEMHGMCLRYFLRLAAIMMGDSILGMFVFGDIGSPHMNDQESVHNEFLSAGYKKISSKNVYIYQLNGKETPLGLIEELDAGVPLYNPSNSSEACGPRDFINFDDGKYTDEYEFYSYLSDWPNSV